MVINMILALAMAMFACTTAQFVSCKLNVLSQLQALCVGRSKCQNVL